MTLEDSGNEDEEDFMGEITDNFPSLDIQIVRSGLEEFVHIDDESIEEYSKAVLEDYVNWLFVAWFDLLDAP
ncbi:uncharacterized protein PHALS_03349 [Plasmopara halstedii]|uniref:Uncharacterized protein n=1 Tax=Plasmopara halstedii TaxID=4781 RepID=A0A0P1A8W5_PLAHL|nr:uncharacterized protein PHALS_03349 [Plasmopara halstedii]CEG36681.1 hypothetical protein PHALS_03349 [Plasmopara halstedii]|eukprot:XP_024573050.1 hypothetical protein PHALS_03349 [Plasmopara halstedii]